MEVDMEVAVGVDTEHGIDDRTRAPFVQPGRRMWLSSNQTGRMWHSSDYELVELFSKRPSAGPHQRLVEDQA
jgi:hypothetical protein